MKKIKGGLVLMKIKRLKCSNMQICLLNEYLMNTFRHGTLGWARKHLRTLANSWLEKFLVTSNKFWYFESFPAQNLFLALCSGIVFAVALGTIFGAREINPGWLYTKQALHLLYYHPEPWVFFIRHLWQQCQDLCEGVALHPLLPGSDLGFHGSVNDNPKAQCGFSPAS